jgi:hypothetical protein
MSQLADGAASEELSLPALFHSSNDGAKGVCWELAMVSG